MNNTDQHSNILPTKVRNTFQFASEVDKFDWEGQPNAVPLWKAQPVLTWVESLAAATEAGERAEGKANGNLSLSNVHLSETSTTPQSAPWALPHHAELPSHVPSSGSGRSSLPSAMPKYWDLRFLAHDQDPQNSDYIRQIASLAIKFETTCSKNMSAKVQDKYGLIQHRLGYLFHRITQESVYDYEEEKCGALKKLYEETIVKLQQVIESAIPKKQTSGHAFSWQSPPSTPVGSSSAFAVSPDTKKNLSKHMTAWIRANWTNPYPDEEGLEELARQCDTTGTVVSNWLINARTRKWRPAIVKATQMNRPANMLLEDSLRIFDGNTIRSLSDQDDKEDDDELPSAKRVKRTFSSTSMTEV